MICHEPDIAFTFYARQFHVVVFNDAKFRFTGLVGGIEICEICTVYRDSKSYLHMISGERNDARYIEVHEYLLYMMQILVHVTVVHAPRSHQTRETSIQCILLK